MSRAWVSMLTHESEAANISQPTAPETRSSELRNHLVLCMPNECQGVLASASLAIHAVGRGLAQAMGTLTGVKQVDRLLSNRGVDVGTFFAYWTPYIVGARKEVIVALEDELCRGRAGHYCAVDVDRPRARDAPAVEDRGVVDPEGQPAPLRVRSAVPVAGGLPAGVKVTVVADRGFADCKLFYALTEELTFE